MAEIVQLTNADDQEILPVTNINAVYNDNGKPILKNCIFTGEESEEFDATLNADTLGGKSRDEYDEEINTLNQNLTFEGNYVFRVGLDGDGNPGFYKADDSFAPFSSAEVVESFYNTETFSTVKSIATYPSYTTLGNVKVTNPKAKKAIVGFMSQTYNGRTGYWRLSVNDIEVDNYSVKGASGSGTPWMEYHTFVIDVKPNDVIKMECATSNGGSQNTGLGYVIQILA